MGRNRDSFYDEAATVDHISPFEDVPTNLRQERQDRTVIRIDDPQPTLPPDTDDDYEAIELLSPEPVRKPFRAPTPAPIPQAESRRAKTQTSQPPSIGRYTLVRLLGQGTFGRVYEACDERLGRRLALKLLNPEQAKCAEIRQRFVQEAHAAACIGHPGIVTVFDAGELDDRGTAYIAMELLAGESLHARLVRRGPMRSDQVREIARQAAHALAAAHHAGIIHRDLKPENLFLVPDPASIEGERVKVLDFGLAKPTLTASVQTQAAVVFGTPAYMSPEQCESTRDIDHRSDIYALGCVLFQLVTGKLVFEGSMRELILQHRGAPAPSILVHVPDACPILAALIASMLAKSPDGRPQTMNDVVRILARAEDGETAKTKDMPALARSHAGKGVKTLGVALVAVFTGLGLSGIV